MGESKAFNVEVGMHQGYGIELNTLWLPVLEIHPVERM